MGFKATLLVIDDYSTDKTLDIARQYHAQIVTRALGGDFSAQRNAAFDFIRTEWVFFLDSDEWLPKKLAASLPLLLEDKGVSGYVFSRRDWFCGRWLVAGETASARFLRLGRVKSGRWERPVHETWTIKGKVQDVPFTINHYPHTSFSSLLKKIDYYSSLEAEKRLGSCTRERTMMELCSYPLAKAIQSLTIRQGFRDGIPGLLMILGMSLHSLLVRIKLMELVKDA